MMSDKTPPLDEKALEHGNQMKELLAILGAEVHKFAAKNKPLQCLIPGIATQLLYNAICESQSEKPEDYHAAVVKAIEAMVVIPREEHDI
mgnify:CR=1 FL=1